MIRCGNCKGHHTTTEWVRVCHTPTSEVGPCSWQVVVAHNEDDGTPVIGECEALTRLIFDGAGWECENGHRHEGIERELGAYGREWEREQYDRMEHGVPAYV